MAQRLIPGIGWIDESGRGQTLIPGVGFADDPMTTGTDGSASGGTGSGSGSGSGGDASGATGGDATASGGTGTGVGSGSGGSAAGASSGSFTSLIMVNNAGSVQAGVFVSWTWWQGSIGSTPTSMTHGTGTTSGTGRLTVSGLPTGAGCLLAVTADGGVYYEPGTVS